MNNSFSLRQFPWLLLLAFITSNAWAYGGGGGQADKCRKPAFDDMVPPKSSVVAPGDEFSFSASSNTNPKSIKVVVKGQSVDLNISKNGKIKATGKLPADLKAGYARINITANSSSKCIGEGGWLLKIEE